MTTRKILSTSVLLFILSVPFLTAQSRYLENGIGGSCFKFNTIVDSGGFNTFGASAAYSIGGIMDVGLSIDRSNGSIQGYKSTDWGVDFIYNLIAIKQTEYVPLSVQLEGTYGFINKTAYDSTNTELGITGQGFSVGGSVFREFNQKGLVSFLIGGKARYSNFLYTTVGSSTSDRTENFRWGGIAAVSLRPSRWPILTLEVEALYDQTAGGMYIEPAFLITTPKM